MINPHKGGSIGTIKATAWRHCCGWIVPDEALLDKQARLRVIRAIRSEQDWKLIYRHRARMSAYLNNIVEFPRRG